MPPWRLAEGFLQHCFHQEVAERIQLERQEARIQGAPAVPSSRCAQEMALPVHTFSGDGLFSFSARHELGSGQFSFPKSTELQIPHVHCQGMQPGPGAAAIFRFLPTKASVPKRCGWGGVCGCGDRNLSGLGASTALESAGQEAHCFSTHCKLEGSCKQSLCPKTSKQLII